MIHGSDASVGCLAMGDEAAEDLFVLAAEGNVGKWKVILAPCDFRVRNGVVPAQSPRWTGDLYEKIAEELKKMPANGPLGVR
ncbi:MAG TPA: hypothetical protein VGQ99_18820 [Tepidisphaeraceae bacterium]|jgi:hypothetical protein|nr:hypothetical protein [Tepidisphaeraceae bacterium]